MKVVYVGPHDEVLVPLAYGEVLAKRGEPIEVPDELALGEPARGTDPADRGPDWDGEDDFWPGTSGLLAQEDLWAAATEDLDAEPDSTGDELPAFDANEERVGEAVNEERVEVEGHTLEPYEGPGPEDGEA